MRELPLTKGYVALVDDEDFERVNQFKWTADANKCHRTVYATRRVYLGGGHHGRYKSVKLHRYIMDVTDPQIQVDHKNHNGLDCQRHNMRVTNNRGNSGNQRKPRGQYTSKFKGVSWYNNNHKWVVRVGRTFIGYFTSEEAAARAYDAAAIIHFGEFAFTNF